MMNFNNSTFLPLFPVPSSSSCMQSFCHCCSPTSLFSTPPPFFQSPFMSDIPLVIAPSPVPSFLSSSPTSTSSNPDNRPSAMLPLRSSSFDLSSMITKARWRREQLGEYLECAFCKSNGEAYEVYSSHRLRDNEKTITLCPILRAHKCPRCHSSGDQAHTMKYCPIKAEIKANRRMREIEIAMKRN